MGHWDVDVQETHYTTDFKWRPALLLSGRHHVFWDKVSELKNTSWHPRWFLELDENTVRDELGPIIFPFLHNNI